MKKDTDIFIYILFMILFFMINDEFKKIKIDYNTKIQTLQTQIDNLTQQIKTNYDKVILTAYHPQSRGINSDCDPDKTATMTKPIPGRTLALSSELVNMGWLGKKIYIEGWGIGKATDRMNLSVEGKRIDICYPTLTSAKQFGIKEDVLAIVLE